MGGYGLYFMFWGLAVAAGLACIPASIAKKKGYNFGLWWLYGWLLFIVAIIHINVIPDKYTRDAMERYRAHSVGQSAADELKKYKELLDQGVITEREFFEKKEQLLKLPW